MASLFLDTSDTLSIGLLDQEFNWLDYRSTNDKKSSAKIHGHIFEMLEKFDLSVSDLEQVFGMAGPGSYTGMRVTDGIGQILELEGIKIFSFYHYQVPALAGNKSGSWFANAYKKEVFTFSWNHEGQENQIIKQDDFISKLESKEFPSPFYCIVPSDFSSQKMDLSNTRDMIHSYPAKLFKNVKEQNLREKVYYYRPLSEEFKVSKDR